MELAYAGNRQVVVQQFDPAMHRDIPVVYRALLGPDAVCTRGGAWTIAHAPDVMNMQSEIANNLMFVMFGTPRGYLIYFAQDPDPVHGTTPRLYVHERMGDADCRQERLVWVVDARRRLRNLENARAKASHVAASNTTERAPHATPTAAQVIAEAIRNDATGVQINTTMLVSRMIDAGTSGDAPLEALHEVAHCDIRYIYLVASDRRAANSHIEAIRHLQRLADVVAELRGASSAAGARGIDETAASRLLEPDIVGPLARALMFVHSDSPHTAKLTLTCTVEYLQLLAALIPPMTLPVDAVFDMLDQTPEGQYFISMLGRRAAAHPTLARAFIGLLDTIVAQGCAAHRVADMLRTPPGFIFNGVRYKGFVKELDVRNPSTSGHAGWILDQLRVREFYCKSTKNAVAARVRAHLMRPFRRERALADEVHIETMRMPRLEAALDRLFDTLRPEALAEMAKINLRATMHAGMPTVTAQDKADLRDIVAQAATEGWRRMVPNEDPPRSLMDGLINSAGPSYENAMHAARFDARNRIVETEVDAYGKFLMAYRYVPVRTVHERFQAHVGAAAAAYQMLTDKQAGTPDATAQALVAQRSAAAATQAARRAAHDLTARALIAAQQEARHDAKRQAYIEASRATRDVTDAALAKSRQSGQERSRQTACQASVTALREAETQSRQKAEKAEKAAREQAQRVAGARSERAARKFQEAQELDRRRVEAVRTEQLASFSTVSMTPSEKEAWRLETALPEPPVTDPGGGYEGATDRINRLRAKLHVS
ncbi:hypothetical protein [Pandoraea faecigallinarum]|uniref:Uncharacterized protein n=1 Tax=Pandoraea faecigallinarum TaxID=656179 RepID=A0A0H3WZP6_9BURK|nr:hypothetical protein [Pandoraea faecigallinarum]